jgi:hypothetical protein
MTSADARNKFVPSAIADVSLPGGQQRESQCAMSTKRE